MGSEYYPITGGRARGLRPEWGCHAVGRRRGQAALRPGGRHRRLSPVLIPKSEPSCASVFVNDTWMCNTQQQLARCVAQQNNPTQFDISCSTSQGPVPALGEARYGIVRYTADTKDGWISRRLSVRMNEWIALSANTRSKIRLPGHRSVSVPQYEPGSSHT